MYSFIPRLPRRLAGRWWRRWYFMFQEADVGASEKVPHHLPFFFKVVPNGWSLDTDNERFCDPISEIVECCASQLEEECLWAQSRASYENLAPSTKERNIHVIQRRDGRQTRVTKYPCYLTLVIVWPRGSSPEPNENVQWAARIDNICSASVTIASIEPNLHCRQVVSVVTRSLVTLAPSVYVLRCLAGQREYSESLQYGSM